MQDIHEQTLNTKLELRKRSQEPFLETVFDGLKHTYNMAGLKGYSGHFDESVIDAIRKHPDVAFVEKDQAAMRKLVQAAGLMKK